MYVHSYKEIDTPYWVASFSLKRGELDESESLLKEIESFCNKMYGPGLGDHRIYPLNNSPFVHRWVNDIVYGEVRFSQEEDLVLFLLRWS